MDDAGSDGDGGADFQFCLGGAVVHLLFQLIEEREDVIGVEKKLLALGGDVQFFGQPLPELPMIMLFQLRNGCADGRLCKIQFPGGCVHSAALGYG